MAGRRVTATQREAIAAVAMTCGKIWRKSRRTLPRDVQENFLDLLLSLRSHLVPDASLPAASSIKEAKHEIADLAAICRNIADRNAEPQPLQSTPTEPQLTCIVLPPPPPPPLLWSTDLESQLLAATDIAAACQTSEGIIQTVRVDSMSQTDPQQVGISCQSCGLRFPGDHVPEYHVDTCRSNYEVCSSIHLWNINAVDFVVAEHQKLPEYVMPPTQLWDLDVSLACKEQQNSAQLRVEAPLFQQSLVDQEQLTLLCKMSKDKLDNLMEQLGEDVQEHEAVRDTAIRFLMRVNPMHPLNQGTIGEEEYSDSSYSSDDDSEASGFMPRDVCEETYDTFKQVGVTESPTFDPGPSFKLKRYTFERQHAKSCLFPLQCPAKQCACMRPAGAQPDCKQQ